MSRPALRIFSALGNVHQLSLHQRVLAGGVVLMLALIVGGCVLRLSFAQAELASAQHVAGVQIADLQRWSGAQQRISGLATAGQPTSDLVTLVQKALNNAGLPAAAFRGIQPMAERTDAASRIQEHTVNLNLADLRASDLGAWLAAWATPEQTWQVVSIAMSHPVRATGSGLDNDKFLVTLALRQRTVVSR